MRSRIVLCLFMSCALIPVAGCSPGAPPPADSSQARDALQTSLDAWKNGESLESLQQRTPSINFRDPDWSAGWKLKEYRLTKTDVPFGQQRRFYVHLSVQHPKQPAAAKEVEYLVDTAPALVIVRAGD